MTLVEMIVTNYHRRRKATKYFSSVSQSMKSHLSFCEVSVEKKKKGERYISTYIRMGT